MKLEVRDRVWLMDLMMIYGMERVLERKRWPWNLATDCGMKKKKLDPFGHFLDYSK